ncbi:hypothetical protein SAMD00019534_035430, partial [Acytostelium subglobosum LB1]|uniref:hypothetical protein n=1 Tax=Acytostelium subglobosum LB1 TaxID=1410327 RepID=UPI000645055A
SMNNNNNNNNNNNMDNIKYHVLNAHDDEDDVNMENQTSTGGAPGATSFEQSEITKKLASENRYDWKLFKRLCHVVKILYSSPLIPSGMVAVLLGLAIAQTYVSHFTGTLLSGVYSDLSSGNTHAFTRTMIFGFLILSAGAILDATIKFVVNAMSWLWRKTLCLALQRKYFDNNLFYRIMAFDTTVDNPDQRITSDIDQFTTLLANVVSQMITGPLVIAYYTYLTWRDMGWYAPAVVYVFFFLGYVANKFIMSPLVSLSFLQDKLEGDFRYLHLRVRSFAESIALQNLARDPLVSESIVEEEQARRQFDVLLNNKKKVILCQYGLTTSSDLFTYLSPLVNYIVIAIPLYMGTEKFIPISDVPIYSYNCIMLASGFSQYINVSTSISDLSSYIQRISTMLEVCDQIQAKKYEVPVPQDNAQENTISVAINDDGGRDNACGEMKIDDSASQIQLNSVSYFTPKGDSLFKNISLMVESGVNLLIMGPSGCGKSSLVRIINGLWPFFYGQIIKPANDSIFFLSQQPYLIYGSLEEQIIYPYTTATKRISRPALRELFNKVDIGYLIDREDEILRRGDLNDLTHNWLSSLSPGEQQLISFMRLIYHRPRFALMDESTSSIPHAIEKRVYDICRENGITTISVGHRSSLIPYHQRLLTFTKNRSWTLQAIDPQQQQ